MLSGVDAFEMCHLFRLRQLVYLRGHWAAGIRCATTKLCNYMLCDVMFNAPIVLVKETLAGRYLMKS